PISSVQFLIAVRVKRLECGIQHLVYHFRAGDFRLCDKLVTVLVVPGPCFFEGNRFDLLSRLILREAPAVDIQIFSIVARNRFHLARKTAYPPDSFAIGDRVSRELKRFWNNNLLRTLFWLINDRCRITRDDYGPVKFPTNTAAVLIERYEIRPQVI